MAKIEIHWSKPILYDNRWNSKNFDEKIGIYLISRRYIRHGICFEIFTYVGETINTFEKRTQQHLDKNSRWLREIGVPYIRFGKINRIPAVVSNEKEFVHTIESTIIQSINHMPNVHLVNKRQMHSWTIYYDLAITNKGCRGVVPEYLNTRDYYEEE